MKTRIFWTIFFVLIIFGGCLIAYYTEEYQIKGTCEQKMVSFTPAGYSIYKVIIKYDDNSYEEVRVDLESYMSYKEGAIYYFTRSRLNWNK